MLRRLGLSGGGSKAVDAAQQVPPPAAEVLASAGETRCGRGSPERSPHRPSPATSNVCTRGKRRRLGAWRGRQRVVKQMVAVGTQHAWRGYRPASTRMRCVGRRLDSKLHINILERCRGGVWGYLVQIRGTQLTCSEGGRSAKCSVEEMPDACRWRRSEYGSSRVVRSALPDSGMPRSVVRDDAERAWKLQLPSTCGRERPAALTRPRRCAPAGQLATSRPRHSVVLVMQAALNDPRE